MFKKIPKYLLNLAGEYRVASELTKRGVFATVTYGNHKAVDVYAISDKYKRAKKIEVKTSQGEKFVTSLGQKNCWEGDPAAPDFWVLFHLSKADDGFAERFFVLTHNEICAVQRARNAIYSQMYQSRHGGAKPDLSSGVDNVRIEDVEEFADQWSKIINEVGQVISDE